MKKDNNLKVLKRLLKKKYFSLILLISIHLYIEKKYSLHIKHTLSQKSHLLKVASFRKSIAEILIVLFLLEYFFTLILMCQ